MAAQVAERIDARVEGNVSGQVAVGNYNLQIGSVHGGTVQVVAPGKEVAPRRRTGPVLLRPRSFEGFLDRQPQLESAISNTSADIPLEFYGESGIGKTSLLQHLAYCEQLSDVPDGVVFLAVRRRSSKEVLQSLFDAFYASDIPLLASDAQLQHALQDIRALVILDDVELLRDELGTLMDVAQACRFLLASEERRMWGRGRAEAVPGLPLEDAQALVERELDRPLKSEERPAVEKLCEVLGGHPLRLLQLAALVREGSQSLIELAGKVQLPSDAATIKLESVKQLPLAHRRLLVALAAAGDVHLPTELLAALAKLPNADAVLGSLERDGYVKSGSPRYRLAGNLQRGFRARMDTAKGQRQVGAALGTWLRQNHEQPDRLLDEADAVLHCTEVAARAGAWREVFALARSLDGALTRGKRWDTWEQMLQLGLEAAQRMRNPAAEAWAMHQYGTRALCLEDASTARRYLLGALEIRESLGDVAGAEITRHNLSLLAPPPSPDPTDEPRPPSPEAGGAHGGSPILPWAGFGIVLIGATAALVWRFVIAPAAPVLQSLNVEPTSVPGGAAVRVEVVLSHPAPESGAVIVLASSDAQVAPIADAQQRIAPGARRATLRVETREVSDQTYVAMTASYAGVRRQATLRVRAPPVELATLRFNSPSVNGGRDAHGTLTLNRPAPGGGVEVRLQSDAPELAAVDELVTVPAGQSETRFDVATTSTARARRVSIKAVIGGSTRSATLEILPVQLTAVVLAQETVIGGEYVQGTVRLSDVAPRGGIILPVRCDDSAVATVRPVAVTIPERQRSATFEVVTAQVEKATSVAITASLGRRSERAELEVRPGLPQLVSVQLDAETAMGERELSGEVRLSVRAPEGGVKVELRSSAPQSVLVDRAILVGEGKRSAAFGVHTKRVSTPQTIIVTARLGQTEQSDDLQLLPLPALASLRVQPPRIVGAGEAVGVLVLTEPAQDQDIVVALKSRDERIALVNPAVTVASGEAEVHFPIRVRSVRRHSNVTIEATYDGQSQRATLEVDVPVPTLRLDRLSLPDEPVVGGERVDGEIRLNQRAEGIATVTITSEDETIRFVGGMPRESVTVRPGNNRVRFQLATRRVRGRRNVLIHASLPGQEPLVGSIVVIPKLRIEVHLVPSPVDGGRSVNGTIRLNRSPLRPVNVTLLSDNPNVQFLSADARRRGIIVRTQRLTVTIGDDAEATFRIATQIVDRDEIATISASLEGQTEVSRELRVTARPVRLSKLYLAQRKVVGGTRVPAHVRLDRPTTADVSVRLVSSMPQIRFLADRRPVISLTIRRGSDRALLGVATPQVDQPTEVLITASLSREDSISQKLVLLPIAPALRALRLEPARLEGGGSVRGTVILRHPSPIPVTVRLTSSDRHAGFLRHGARLSGTQDIVIRPNTTAATFTLRTIPVPGPVTVGVSAQLAGRGPRVEYLELRSPAPLIEKLGVFPSQVVGGEKAAGLVSLNRPAGRPVRIVLSSDNPRARFAVARQVVSFVIVAPDSTTARFDVITPKVNVPKELRISASVDGRGRTTSVTLKPRIVLQKPPLRRVPPRKVPPRRAPPRLK